MEKVTGKRYQYSDFKTWDIFSVLTEEEFQACAQIIGRKGFCSRLKPLPGALEAIRELRKTHHVVAVTSPWPTPNWAHERTEFLLDVFGFEREDIILTSGKSLIPGDYLVDDRPKTVKAWEKSHPQGDAMLWNLPHTEKVRGFAKNRVFSWSEVMERVNAY